MSLQSNSIQNLRTKMASILSGHNKAAGAMPADPQLQGGVSVPADEDKSDLAPSTPGQGTKNTPTMKPEDAGLMTKTNPGEGPKVHTTDGSATEKMAKLRKTMADLQTKLASKPAATPEVTPTPAATPAAKTASSTPEAGAEVLGTEQAKIAYDTFASIGAALCASEEGRRQVEFTLAKQAGEARAAELLQEAVKAAAVYEQVGRHMELVEQEEQQKAASAQAQWDSAPPEVKAAAVKLASARERAIESGIIRTPIEMFFFTKGASMAEAMLPGGPAAGADPAAGLPGAGAEPSPEDIVAAVMEAVAAGQMSEEDAKALLESYGIPWPGEAGAGADPAAGGAPPPEDAAAKQASVLIAELCAA